MTNNSNEESKTPPAPESGMSSFRKALLWTAIPTVTLSIISLIGDPVWIVWIGAAIYILIAFVVLIFILILGDRDIAAGILAGVGIGIVTLGATCFANLGRI
ncbi:hypothetical protein ACFLUX_00915 [Chloroflexota bacterium]